MTPFKTAIFVTIFAATAAFAHDGVENPAVKARMAAMETIGANMKILVTMAKGQSAFSADGANTALAMIAQTAATVPGLFEAEEDDPKSEAAAEIWFDWDDFVAKAGALEAAATAAGGITGASDLGPALGLVGAACKACHSLYKL